VSFLYNQCLNRVKIRLKFEFEAVNEFEVEAVNEFEFEAINEFEYGATSRALKTSIRLRPIWTNITNTAAPDRVWLIGQ